MICGFKLTYVRIKEIMIKKQLSSSISATMYQKISKKLIYLIRAIVIVSSDLRPKIPKRSLISRIHFSRLNKRLQNFISNQ